MTAKERILLFIENQSITVNQFCKKNLLSNSFFNNKSAIGSDKLLNIFNNYPELNMDWVITGRGGMLNNKVGEILNIAAEDQAEYTGKIQAMSNEIIALQKQVIDQMKTIRELEFKTSLQTSVRTEA